jgi:hypothetical protein
LITSYTTDKIIIVSCSGLKNQGGRNMKGKTRFLVLLLLIAVFVSGCSLFGKKKGDVTVSLFLEDNTPLTGIELVLKKDAKVVKAKTNNDGKALFQVDDIGEYTITGEVVLYDGTKEAISKQINLKAGTNPEVPIKLATIGQLGITVVDKKAKPIANSELVISVGENEKKIPLEAEGKIQFYAKIGTYNLKAKINDFVSEISEVELTSKKLEKVLEINIETIEELAIGKAYEIFNLDINKTAHDADGTRLTDGIFGDPNKGPEDSSWASYNQSDKEKPCGFIVDLEAVKDLRAARVQAYQYHEWGVFIPSKISIELSEDKTTWSEPVIVEKESRAGETYDEWFEFTLAGNGRYVKVTIEPFTNIFMWLGEISVQGVEE